MARGFPKKWWSDFNTLPSGFTGLPIWVHGTAAPAATPVETGRQSRSQRLTGNVPGNRPSTWNLADIVQGQNAGRMFIDSHSGNRRRRNIEPMKHVQMQTRISHDDGLYRIRMTEDRDMFIGMIAYQGFNPPDH